MPLTWQQVLIVLLCLPLLAGLAMAFLPDIPAEVRRMGGMFVAVCLPLIFGLTVWHILANNQPDLEPDILAKLVDLRAIYQLGNGAHMWISAEQDGDVLVLMCILQNLVDATTYVDVTLDVDKGREFLGFVPGLSASLPPACVARALLRVPVRPGMKARKVRFAIGASAKPGEGKRLRFGRRQVLSKKVNAALTGALLLTGTLYAGGGTFLEVHLQPAEPSPEPPDPGPRAWEIGPLWEPGDPTDDAFLTERLTG